MASLRAAEPATAASTATYDLRVGVTGTVTGRPGQVVSVAVSWRNAGPAAVRGVRVVYTPPLGTAVAPPLPAGWVVSGRTAVHSQTGSVASGTARSAAVSVRIPATAVAGSLLVGGGVDITGGAGTDSRPANNHATNRVSVVAAAPSPKSSTKASPKTSAKASPKPSAKASPKPSAQGSPSPSPKAASAAASVKPTAAPARPTPTASRHAPVREPKLTASTIVIAAPAPSGPPIVDVVPVIDGNGLFAGIELVPLAGAIACFTAAGTGMVMVRRRRAGERAHQAEIRSVELANEPRPRSAQRV